MSFTHNMNETDQQETSEFIFDEINLEEDGLVKKEDNDDDNDGKALCEIIDSDDTVMIHFKCQDADEGNVNEVKEPRKENMKAENVDKVMVEEMYSEGEESARQFGNSNRESSSNISDRESVSNISDKECNSNTRDTEEPMVITHEKVNDSDMHFSCTECSESYSDQEDLKRHLRDHAGEGPFKCLVCQKQYSQKQDLWSHVTSHTDSVIELQKMWETDDESNNVCESDGEPLKCHECNMTFSVDFDLQKHLETHSNNNRRCLRKRKASKIVLSHGEEEDEEGEEEEEEEGTRTFRCNACQKNYATRRGLNRHLRVHNGERPYRCLVCNKRYSYKHDLHNHVKSHTTSLKAIHKLTENVDKPFECNTCGKKFPFKFDFENHVNVHSEIVEGINESSDEESSKCPIATSEGSSEREEALEDLYSCTVGSKGANSNIKRRYKCPDCKKCFQYKKTLDSHLRTHSGEKPFNDLTDDAHAISTVENRSECAVCRMRFPSRFALQKHLQGHKSHSIETQRKLGEKPFACQICCKKFAYGKALNKHMQKHSQQPEFVKCHVCKKGFAGKTKLSLHMRYHTCDKMTEESSDCAVCGKHCESVVSLEMHKKTHFEDYKAHECKLCRKCFVNASELNKHNDNHTKLYECDACGRCFAEEKQHICKPMKRGYQEPPHHCKKCDLEFFKFAEFRKHLLQQFRGSHSCVQCGKCFEVKEERDLHSLVCIKLHVVDSILHELM